MRKIIKKIKDTILNTIEDWFYKKKLKEDYIYKNDTHDVILNLNPESKSLNVFIKGLIYKLPLSNPLDFLGLEEDVENLSNLNFDDEADLELLTEKDLTSLLKQTEVDEDYEKCRLIRDVLKRKQNEKTN